MKSLFDQFKPVLLLLAIIALAVYGLHLNHQDGYDEGYAVAKAEGDKALAERDRAHAQASTDAANKAVEDLRTEQARGNQLARQLADTRDNLRKTTDQLTGEIAHVTKLYRRSLDAQPEPLPVAVFTNGFVRVWNSANGITTGTAVPSPGNPSGTAAAPSRTEAADDLDSGLGQAQLLANQVRNGELHNTCRAQLNRLIDWTLNGSN